MIRGVQCSCMYSWLRYLICLWSVLLCRVYGSGLGAVQTGDRVDADRDLPFRYFQFPHTFVMIFCTSSSLGSKISLINRCYFVSVRLYPIDCAIFGVHVSTRRI